MKNKLIILLLVLVLFTGCNLNKKTDNDSKNDEVEYQQVYFRYKKIDNETIKIYGVYENVSEKDVVIGYVGYGANDKNNQNITNSGHETEVEFKSHHQVLLTGELKVDVAKVDYAYMAPFYEYKATTFMKEVATTRLNAMNDDSKNITSNVTSFESQIENNNIIYSVNIKADKNIDTKRTKLVLYDLESYPLCISYSDVSGIKKDETLSIKFACDNSDYKIDHFLLFYE